MCNRINRIALVCVFIFMSGSAVSFAAGPNPLFVEVTLPAKAADLKYRALPARILRERLVAVDFALMLKPADVLPGQRLDIHDNMIVGKDRKPQKKRLLLNLFQDRNLVLNLERVENNSPDGDTVSWFGRVEGFPDSEVILVNTDNVMSGNITLPGGKFFQIRFVRPGVHAIREIDQTTFPPEAEPRVVEPPPASRQTQGQNQTLDQNQDKNQDTGPGPGLDQAAPEESAPDTSSDLTGDPDEIYNIIDVMVLYTPAARSAAGGTTAMRTLIDLAITETNQGYANSHITQRIKLVNRVEVSYTETSSNAFDNALDALTSKTDGEIDFIHSWRDTYKADIVSMFIDDHEWCGLGWVMYTESHDFEDSAFSVVDWDCATGYYSFAHEMGHNQGGKHDIDHSSDDGVFAYSHGYQDPSGEFRTIMAYSCPGGCTRVNYWSNTVVTYGDDNKDMGDAATADMRRSHNNTYDTASNWRVRVTSAYVKHDWTGLEIGTSLLPFNTIHEGVNSITPSTQNGNMWVTPGTYNETLTIDKSILFHNWGTGYIIVK